MKIIRSSQKHDRTFIIFVDDEDHPKLCKYVWSTIYGKGPTPYANSYSLGKMHRVILDVPLNLEVHHLDGNGLNNTRANIKIVDRATNIRLQGPQKRGTGYKGVKKTRAGHFVATIWNRHYSLYIGTYVTAEAAARAYDEAARKLWGAECYLNFPETGRLIDD